MGFLGREAARKTRSPGWCPNRGFLGPSVGFAGKTSLTPDLTGEDGGTFLNG
jgi:hypothetical protein